jgi:Fe2+ or Zn2+ uptake regulation protein/O6-methylguanine-DNA--protein-cysteine methyltransferase
MTDHDDVGAVLRRHDLRVTPQRRAILQAFRGTRDEHLSAEEVMSRANASVPGISRGTVYATLGELGELGLLASVGDPDPVRYETNLDPHDHFRCRLCLRLFDIDLGGDQIRRRQLAGYTIEAFTVRAEGVCAECTSFERGLRDGAREITRTPTLPPAALDALSCALIETPLGELALAAAAGGIVRVAYRHHADFGTLAERARSRRGSSAGRAHNRQLSAELEAYFAGEHAAPAEPIDWRLTADGQEQTLQSVQRIPYGSSRSYSQLGGGLSAYDCGHILGANPLALIVPCHRVNRGSERPGVYVGGTEPLHILRSLENA